MISISAYKPLNRWDHDYILPGPVGSVGDAHVQIRLKQSTPSMNPRWDPNTSGRAGEKGGSNIQDGSYESYSNHGRQAKVEQAAWTNSYHQKTSHGWIFQNLRKPDQTVQPQLSSTYDYSWRNKVANVYKAANTGKMFLPLPGGYSLPPNAVPRGGQVVRVTDSLGGSSINTVTLPEILTSSGEKPTTSFLPNKSTGKRYGG